jgi:hypothetical protein
MTEVRRPHVPLSPRGPAEPATVPFPRIPPPHGYQPPSPQPRGRRRPLLLVAIAVAAVAVLVLGAVLLARPGALVAAQPCEAPAGSALPGFEGVVGPNPLGEVSSLVETRMPGGQACSYATSGATLEAAAQVGGHLVLLVRAPQAAVEADPNLSAAFRADGTTSSSASAYPVPLVRSGVTVMATPSGSGANALAATCVVGTDYWSVSVASYAQQDDAGAVDDLLVAMGCGPVPS